MEFHNEISASANSSSKTEDKLLKDLLISIEQAYVGYFDKVSKQGKTNDEQVKRLNQYLESITFLKVKWKSLIDNERYKNLIIIHDTIGSFHSDIKPLTLKLINLLSHKIEIQATKSISQNQKSERKLKDHYRFINIINLLQGLLHEVYAVSKSCKDAMLLAGKHRNSLIDNLSLLDIFVSCYDAIHFITYLKKGITSVSDWNDSLRLLGIKINQANNCCQIGKLLWNEEIDDKFAIIKEYMSQNKNIFANYGKGIKEPVSVEKEIRILILDLVAKIKLLLNEKKFKLRHKEISEGNLKDLQDLVRYGDYIISLEYFSSSSLGVIKQIVKEKKFPKEIINLAKEIQYKFDLNSTVDKFKNIKANDKNSSVGVKNRKLPQALANLIFNFKGALGATIQFLNKTKNSDTDNIKALKLSNKLISLIDDEGNIKDIDKFKNYCNFAKKQNYLRFESADLNELLGKLNFFIYFSGSNSDSDYAFSIATVIYELIESITISNSISSKAEFSSAYLKEREEGKISSILGASISSAIRTEKIKDGKQEELEQEVAPTVAQLTF